MFITPSFSSYSKKFYFLTLCRYINFFVIKFRKKKNIFWAGYAIPGCLYIYIYIYIHIYIYISFFLSWICSWMFEYLFYCILCVPIVDIYHIALLCVFLLLVYYKFYKGIFLGFLQEAIATVILIFYYYYS